MGKGGKNEEYEGDEGGEGQQSPRGVKVSQTNPLSRGCSDPIPIPISRGTSSPWAGIPSLHRWGSSSSCSSPGCVPGGGCVPGVAVPGCAARGSWSSFLAVLGLAGMWHEVIPALLGNPGLCLNTTTFPCLPEPQGPALPSTPRDTGTFPSLQTLPGGLWMAQSSVPKMHFGACSQLSCSSSLTFLGSGGAGMVWAQLDPAQGMSLC